MRTTEGVGLVAPKPVRVPITPADRVWAYRVATERAEYRRYAARQDAWGAGLLGNDPRNAVYIGLLGELAFARWVSRVVGSEVAVDTTFRLAGDGGVDFSLFGYGIQVKTATSDYDELLVRSSSVACPDWDIIARVQYPPRATISDNGLFGVSWYRDRSVAELCGWSWLSRFREFATIQNARIGTHMNQVLRPERFQPMSELADILTAKMLRGNN